MYKVYKHQIHICWMDKVGTLFYLLIFHDFLKLISDSEICPNFFIEDMEEQFTNFYSCDNLANLYFTYFLLNFLKKIHFAFQNIIKLTNLFGTSYA